MDAGKDSSPEGGAACCPVDSSPDCCMNFGGWSQDGSCGRTCDGMPLPNDPGWKLDKDSHGCRVWTHPAGLDPGSGNGVPRCGGADSGAKDASTVDANGE